MGWRTLYKGSAETEKQDPESIFCPQNNYGYHINITHPVAAYFLEQYREEIKAGSFPLSDTERLDFERRFLNWIANNNLEIEEGGKLAEVTMQNGEPVIDHGKRDARINRVISEEGKYDSKPTFDVPDSVKQDMADKRKTDVSTFQNQKWEKE